MSGNVRLYRSWRQQKLADSKIAETYLDAAFDDSPRMLLKALLNVAQARQNVAAIAARKKVASRGKN
jgi:DNA-binding phage protein